MNNIKYLLLFFSFSVLSISCSKDPVAGCTDASSASYNPDAEEDDGSCVYNGCTDVNADNYNMQANNDDGSCIYNGCSDTDADNYSMQANNDDGSCTYFDRFLGNYSGVFECDDAFKTLLDDASSMITRKPGDDNLDEVTVIVSNPATDITLLLSGTLTKDVVTIDTYIQNFEYTLESGPLVIEGPFEVFVTGTLTRAADNSLSGPVTIRIDKTDLALSISDVCIYTAVKI